MSGASETTALFDGFLCLVLDPLYAHNPGEHMTDDRHNNKATTEGMSHQNIRLMYSDGIADAMTQRVGIRQAGCSCLH
ncbi:hypothetical protein A5631_01080 [Mycolicibacter heraklionensis]|nr:hypothetical protein A5631_01080 [Mycolicibacter heraklionensis]